MTVSDYYLISFVVGFGLTAVSFFLGLANFHIHIHLPHVHLPGLGVGHVPDLHIGHGGHVGHAGHGGHIGHAEPAQGGAPNGHGGNTSGGELPYVNFGTVTAFLAWFGGMGYVLSRHTHLYFWSALFISGVTGLFGASLVFMLVSRLIVRHEHEMGFYENHPLGALGRVVSTIREGGTGEIIFVAGDRRRTSGARAEDGKAIAKGTEIIVTRYEKGIAYVRTWDEVNAEVDAISRSSSCQG